MSVHHKGITAEQELEICWARIADLRQLAHDYAKEHDRAESSGTGRIVRCDCILCKKTRQADHWRTKLSELEHLV